ncbi:MAG: undecaprenyldiphospho-muramoylpentapeptide beta-N-acetylglucosaminyltransferase [Deltaproteobacteria bacterium]|nr:undecaprenyldiphospho-muramoylpentapeptide beta-N-acetylglucosaminyltransferase [Deltaproteobacteria bacterium]
MIERILVAGGGTGGHLFPGVAVVEELRRRIEGLEVTFVGTERGIEARVLPEMGENLELLEVTPLKGRKPGQLVSSLAKLPGAAGRALSLVRRYRPDLVLGVGGYASGPVLAAAAALGVPTAILEQNAHVGMTNKILAKVVGRAYVSFEETREVFREDRVRVVGNPVRQVFVDAARRAATDPDGFEARGRRVFVLGGSQGARALNQTVPKALARAGLSDRGISVLHQAGAAMRDEVEASYRELGVDAEVVPFIDDMAAAYASASLVVCRAGATTVAELCAVGRPAILVPFPHAADDHQGKNAEALERVGAAVAMREDRLSVRGLAEEVSRLLDDGSARRAMAAAARGAGRPDAAAAIVDDLFSWLDHPEKELREEGPAFLDGAGDMGSDGDAADDSGGSSETPVRRSSMPGRVPYRPVAATAGVRRMSSRPPAPRPSLMVGWGD